MADCQGTYKKGQLLLLLNNLFQLIFQKLRFYEILFITPNLVD